MVAVAGKPILQWALEALKAAGISEVTLVVGHKEASIQSFFQEGASLGLSIRYVHQPQPIGTAHAVAAALKDVGVPDSALILGGDNVIDARLVRDIMAAGPDALAVAKSTIPGKYGVVAVTGGMVTGIKEKPPVDGDAIVSTGAVLLGQRTLDRVSELVERGLPDLPDALDALLSEGLQLRAVATSGEWLDAVEPWDLVPLTELLLLRAAPAVSKDAEIDPAASIEGAIHVAGGTNVAARAVVAGPTSLGANVRIGPGAVVSRSLVMDDVKIGPGAIVEGSVVADGATIGAGAILGAGTVFPQATDSVRTDARLGAIVGEGSVVGPGAVLAPGTILGVGVTVAPGAVVRGRIPDRGWVM